jgi:hypothetical protein
MKAEARRKIPVKRHLSCISLSILILTLLIIPLLPTSSADGQDATFDSIDVRAVPPVQGMGGEIRVEVVANFFGGCCYQLYAKNVKAELENDNFEIVSSLPKTINTVDAEAGGQATTVSFHWNIIGYTPGIYDLTVKVSTSNCGSIASTVQVRIVEGASISPPTIFPTKPSVKEPITFSAVIRSGSDLTEINKADIYIWHSEEDYSEMSLKAEMNKIYKILDDGKGSSNNSSAADSEDDIKTEILGDGKGFQMKHVEFSDTWRVQLNDFRNEENIYYWFNVETTDGKNVTSAVYKQSIEDLEKKYQTLETVKWGSFFIIVIGILFILGISWKYFDRPARGFGKTGIFILGSKIFSKPSEGKRSNIPELSIAKFRMALLMLFLILTILMIIISIYLGLYQELITETGG